jgi:predicted secreted protein
VSAIARARSADRTSPAAQQTATLAKMEAELQKMTAKLCARKVDRVWRAETITMLQAELKESQPFEKGEGYIGWLTGVYATSRALDRACGDGGFDKRAFLEGCGVEVVG